MERGVLVGSNEARKDLCTSVKHFYFSLNDPFFFGPFWRAIIRLICKSAHQDGSLTLFKEPAKHLPTLAFGMADGKRVLI